MGALPNKKKAVVAIDAARRRRRLPTGPDKPNYTAWSKLGLALALVFALAATAFGSIIVYDFIRQGNYGAAAVAPFWVIVPGCAPLFILLRKRRRAARAAGPLVFKLNGGGPRGKPRRR